MKDKKYLDYIGSSTNTSSDEWKYVKTKKLRDDCKFLLFTTIYDSGTVVILEDEMNNIDIVYCDHINSLPSTFTIELPAKISKENMDKNKIFNPTYNDINDTGNYIAIMFGKTDQEISSIIGEWYEIPNFDDSFNEISENYCVVYNMSISNVISFLTSKGLKFSGYTEKVNL